MTKSEFLDQLRTSLTGEIPDVEVENNIKFYDDYIGTKSNEISYEEVMEQLGAPRLIAKTIVETYQISHAPLYNSKKHERAYKDVHTTDDSDYEDQQNTRSEESNHYERNSNFQIHSSITWYQKLLLIVVAITFIFLFIIIGGIILRLFFSIGIPILIIYIGYKVIKNSMRR